LIFWPYYIRHRSFYQIKFDGFVKSPSAALRCILRAQSLFFVESVDLFFTENFSTLLKAGGIAALLKYKTSKKPRGIK